MSYQTDHRHEPDVHDSSDGMVGFAAIKYTAIVVIVLAILAFLAWYVLPRIG
jgi:hypothetical protein